HDWGCRRTDHKAAKTVGITNGVMIGSENSAIIMPDQAILRTAVSGSSCSRLGSARSIPANVRSNDSTESATSAQRDSGETESPATISWAAMAMTTPPAT